MDRDYRVYVSLYTMGLQPWTAERGLAVEVQELDDDVAEGVMVTCTGAVPGGASPCSREMVTVIKEPVGSPSFRLSGGLATFDPGWELLLELESSAAGTERLARACRVSVTDAFPEECRRIREPVCASGGVLEVATEGHTLSLRGQLTFPDGLEMDLALGSVIAETGR